MKTKCSIHVSCIYSQYELAKAVATFRLGGEVDRIVLWPLGGLSVFGGNDVRSDLKVVFAGLFSRIPVLFVFGATFLIFRAEIHVDSKIDLWEAAVYVSEIEAGFGPMFLTTCRRAFWITVFLTFVHILIPIYPMDGLRIWVGFLKGAGMSLQKAAMSAASAGMVISFGLIVFGIVQVFRGRFGIPEFGLGAFGVVVSLLLYKLAKTGSLSEDIVLGRPCYEDGASTSTATSGNDGEVEIPTTTTSTLRQTSNADGDTQGHGVV